MQTHFPLVSGLVEILDRHVHDAAHARERLNHHAIQGPVPQSDQVIGVDGLK
jgi:hypothetical protein